jgi:hypothetical protein
MVPSRIPTSTDAGNAARDRRELLRDSFAASDTSAPARAAIASSHEGAVACRR